jgi:hypothetical protein
MSSKDKKAGTLAPKEEELFELIQDAVADLHRIADQLERYAVEALERQKILKGEGDAGTTT